MNSIRSRAGIVLRCVLVFLVCSKAWRPINGVHALKTSNSNSYSHSNSLSDSNDVYDSRFSIRKLRNNYRQSDHNSKSNSDRNSVASRRSWKLLATSNSDAALESNNSNSNSDSQALVTAEATPESRPSSIYKINFLMFLFYANLGSVMPFLPNYYRTIGVPDYQIGVLGSITPAVTFLVSPLWGAFADTTGRHKLIMLLTFIGSVLARCTFALQPSSQLALGTIVAITAILNAPVKPLLDSAVLSMIADKSAYGKSRLFGQLGFGLGSFFTGRYLNNNMQNVFIAHAAFMVPTAIIMTTFRPKVVNNTEHESTSENNNKKGGKKKGDFGGTKISKRDLFRELRTVLLKPKNFIFFFVVFSIGVSSGIIENFAYIRIGEVAKLAKNTDSNVLGTCRLVSSLAGGPMFWLSGKVLDLLGINGVLTASLVAYIARFFIYATITNPWHAIPAEILRGATFATFWSGCTYYVYNISPPGLSATMLGILNAMYGGLGQSTGALLGGAMSDRMGIAKTFIRCGAMEGIVLLTFLGYRLFLHLKEQREQKLQKLNTSIAKS